jgi:hypothetical protein
MLIEHEGSEQGETPNVSEASDTTQPDQAALEKKEKMRAYKREYNRQWRKEHPDRAREIGREAARRKRATEQGREYVRNYQREWRKGKRDARRASARANEHWDNLPPLHPIFERLSDALAKQQTSPAGETTIFPEPVERSVTPQSPPPERPQSTRSRNPYHVS